MPDVSSAVRTVIGLAKENMYLKIQNRILTAFVCFFIGKSIVDLIKEE